MIDGVERLQMYSDTIMPGAACTSTQAPPGQPRRLCGVLRCPGDRRRTGRRWRELAVPVRQSLAESRIPLFEQSADTRPEELKAQGVRPRVWFGERWITSIFDLFEENSGTSRRCFRSAAKMRWPYWMRVECRGWTS